LIILGFCAYVFDSAACLIIDGELIAASQEERFTREKNTGDFPKESIDFCLKKVGITIEDVDHVAFYWEPFLGLKERVLQIFKGLPHTLNFWNSHSSKWLSMVLAENELKKNFKGKHRFTFHNINHHISHAASTFLVSPYEKANIIVMDGSGEIVSTSFGYASDRDIDLPHQIKFPESMGYVYVSLTQYLGFKPDSDEYKVMALASMGQESKYYDLFKDVINLEEDGHYSINLKYFNYQLGIREPWVSKKFIKEFGPIRMANSSEDLTQRHFDIAWALQKRLEDVAIHMANILYEKNPCDNLVISGGCALNCVMNEKLLQKTPYKNVWTNSAPHDAGTCIGAAMYVHNNILDRPRTFQYNSALWGAEYTEIEIEKVIKANNYAYQTFTEEELYKKAAQVISDGAIIGWFQGRTEFGPRALGNRSILADPRTIEMKEKINARIKHREEFRPFAPAILEEHSHDFFKISRKIPFMTSVVEANTEKLDKMQAVIHFNNTSRVQTVEEEVNPKFYKLIKAFYNITNTPLLLNTSFNDNGEPIVNSPEDALKSFRKTNLDYLFIGNFLIEKKQRV
jgi:carbamoyltransferase